MCTFEVLVEDYGLHNDPALARLARTVHAADIASELGFDRPITDLDHDSLDLPATGTLPVGIAGVTPDTW